MKIIIESLGSKQVKYGHVQRLRNVDSSIKIIVINDQCVKKFSAVTSAVTDWTSK